MRRAKAGGKLSSPKQDAPPRLEFCLYLAHQWREAVHTYGGLILKTNRAALEAEIGELKVLIEAHKQTVLKRFCERCKKID